MAYNRKTDQRLVRRVSNYTESPAFPSSFLDCEISQFKSSQDLIFLRTLIVWYGDELQAIRCGRSTFGDDDQVWYTCRIASLSSEAPPARTGICRLLCSPACSNPYTHYCSLSMRPENFLGRRWARFEGMLVLSTNVDHSYHDPLDLQRYA